MKSHLLAFLILGFSASAVSQTDAHTEKVKTLMEALGLIDMWSQQIEFGRARNEEMGQQALDQVLSQLNPDEEYRERFTNATNSYLKKFETPWSAEEIVEVWAGYYGPNFTNEELDQLIEFYTSEIGQKDVAVTKQTLSEFSEHFQRETQPIFENAFREYIEELGTIARECNCQK